MTCVSTEGSQAREDCYRYLDWCPTAIGLTPRAVELLEKYEGITTVRGLLSVTPQKLLSIPQFSRGTLSTVYQCLANVGFNVPGYAPQREHNAEEVSEDDDTLLGFAKTRSMRLYLVSPSAAKRVIHPKINPKAEAMLPPPKPQRKKRMPRTAKTAPATSPANDVPAELVDVRFTIGVSQELANQGVFITRYHTPIPLPLASTCFVVLLDLQEGKIVSSFMAYRPTGVTQDVLVYDAATRSRVVSTQIDHIGGLPVYVDVAATFEDIAPYCQPNLEKTLLDIKTDLKQSIEALAADDLKAPHVERAAMFPTQDRSRVEPPVEVVGEEAESAPFSTDDDEESDEELDDELDDEDSDEEFEDSDDEFEDDEDSELDDSETDDSETDESDDEDSELEDDDSEYEDDEDLEDGEDFEDEDSEEFEPDDSETDDDEFEDDEDSDEELLDEDSEDEDDEFDDEELDEDSEEEELDLTSMDVKTLMQVLAPMSLEQLRSRASLVGVSRVKCEQIKTAESMRQQIINAVTKGQRK